MSVSAHFDALTEGARLAADRDRKMTVKAALRMYRKGVIWSLVFMSAIIMEGFDLALLSGFYAFPAFVVSLQRRPLP